MTKTEAMKVVCVLFGSFPNARFNEQNFESYADGIQDLDATACGAAAQRLIRTNKFLPAIAELREAATAQHHGLARSGAEAYTELTEAVRRHGRDYGQGSPRFRDPLITRCLGVWGTWNDLCGSPTDDPGGRARFIELYGELATRDRQNLAAGKPLPVASTGRAFWLDRPKVQPEPAAERAEPAAVLAVLAPRPRPLSRPPSPYAGRKLSAAEIDAALGAEEAAQ